MSYERTRTVGGLTPVNALRYDIDQTCSSGTVLSVNFVGAYEGIFTSMTDILTPNYKRRSARGEVIISPMTKATEEHSFTGTHVQYHFKSNSCSSPVKHFTYNNVGPHACQYVSGSPKPVPINCIDSEDIIRARSLAATSAWSSANAHDGGVLEDIAEIRQTLNLLRDPLQSGNAFLRRLKSRSWRNVGLRAGSKEAYDYAASMWLQYRYGIRPLVHTIDAVLRQLQIDERPRRFTARGESSLFGSSQVSGTWNAHTSYAFDYNLTYGDSYDVRTGMVIEEVVSLQRALGVDASGMLALPWELVPYSFVADWFVNVGDFIYALLPYLTKRPLGSWTTTTRRRTVTLQVTNSWCKLPGTYQWDRGSNNLFASTYTDVVRAPGLAGPSLTWRPQSIQGVTEDLRLIDALTLFTSQMNRLFKG